MKTQVLLVTGFAPVKLPQLGEMGIPTAPIQYLSELVGKETLQFSIPTVAGAVLAGYLERRGVDVQVKDYFLDEVDFRGADIIGISSTFLGVEDVKQIAARARAERPDSSIVLGGPLSWSVPPAYLMEQVPNLDYIIVREGESTLLELVRAIESGDRPDGVDNLMFRRDGKLVATAGRVPAYSGEILPPAWKIMGIPSARRLPVLPVETSRGCPFNCAYCSEVTYWGKPVRYRDVDEVIKELRHNVTELGISTFRFTDSCFSAPPTRCAALCDAIYDRCIAQGMDIKWSSYARVNNLSAELLEKMRRAGCVALDIGVESGSDSMLRSMGREYRADAGVAVAERARELGIVTNFNVVVGFPGETRESITETAELIQRAAPDTFACFQFYLAPNTRVEADCAGHGLEGSGLHWKHDTMTSEEAEEGIIAIGHMVTSSANFPGGEYFTCYLTSLGYTVAEVKRFYGMINSMVTLGAEGAVPPLFERIAADIKRYW